MALSLHRSEKQPDWELLEPGKKPNAWQRMAARTKGWFTPGNVVTGAGSVLSFDGLADIASGNKSTGLIKLAIGRTADVVDGTVADKTGTKSPLGEALDAGLDKVQTAAAIGVLAVENIVPLEVIGVLGVEQVAIAGLTMVARRRGRLLHPSRSGKLNMGFLWGSFGSFVAAEVAKGTAAVYDSFETVGYVSGGVAAALGAKALVGYVRDSFGRQPETEVMAVPEIPGQRDEL